jgi:hypothetical protein
MNATEYKTYRYCNCDIRHNGKEWEAFYAGKSVAADASIKKLQTKLKKQQMTNAFPWQGGSRGHL